MLLENKKVKAFLNIPTLKVSSISLLEPVNLSRVEFPVILISEKKLTLKNL
jgi:hypothetical protein